MDLGEYRLDVLGFADKVLGVELHKGQKRILAESFPRGVEPSEWPYRFVHIRSGNRFGKSVMLAVLHLWFAIFKHRLPGSAPYGSAEWFDSPYNVANLCPLNDIAYVVREKVGLILQNKAKEQIQRIGGRGSIHPGVQQLFKSNQSDPKEGNPFLLRVPDTEYYGYVTEHNSNLEYRTVDDHAKAMQGRAKYLITIDEVGRHKDPLTLIGSDIAPRVIDTGGIIVTATTPHLASESNYEEIWSTGDPNNPDRKRYSISFSGSMTENPHVTAQMIEEALDGVEDYLRPQVIEGAFIQSSEAFYNAENVQLCAVDIPNKRRRTPGHQYVIGWDLAISKAGDRSIGIVIDVTESPSRVVEYLELPKGTEHPLIVMEMYKQMAWYHNEKAKTRAILVYDSTGMAGHMFKTELKVIYPKPIGFDYAGTIKKKLNMLQSLRVLIDKGLIVFPKTCTRLVYELKHYKLADKGQETDAVMALALAAHIVERTRGRLGNDKRIIFGSLTP